MCDFVVGGDSEGAAYLGHYFHGQPFLTALFINT